MRKILCFLGIHDWEFDFTDWCGFHEHVNFYKCKCCGETKIK